MPGECKKLRRQRDPSIYRNLRFREIRAQFRRIVPVLFSQPEARPDGCQQVPEVVGNAPGEFAKGREPSYRCCPLLPRGGRR